MELETLRSDMIAAMKAKDKARKEAISSLISAADGVSLPGLPDVGTFPDSRNSGCTFYNRRPADFCGRYQSGQLSLPPGSSRRRRRIFYIFLL